MAIRLLDAHTAELIAAGEVVERPASVVKEMVENAIDAGAHTISVEIEQGGTSLIKIVDDGDGIKAEDIQLAFVRHATSKIRTEKDLDTISTLGFRGEALASIASVAQVEVLTRTALEDTATFYSIHGGKEIALEPAARPVGTSLTVKNLFYNTPARMKFLKKNASEATYVTETVTRLALSHPEIAFKYVKESKVIFATPGDGKLNSVVYSVLGKELAQNLVPISSEENQYQVAGQVVLPHAGRGSRSMQFFFINGRFVKNNTIMAALEQSYKSFMMQGRFPAGIIFLQMPPELVDVNVHPAKTQVRFASEKDVFNAVYQAVKSSILNHLNEHPSLEVNISSDNKLIKEQNDPKIENKIISENESVLSSKQLPYMTQKDMRPVFQAEIEEKPLFKPLPSSERDLDILFEDEIGVTEKAEEPQNIKQIVKQQTFLSEQADEIDYIGEIFDTYIIARWKNSLCLLDKHAAHERLLYEQLVKNKTEVAVQQLIEPVTVALAAEEKNALLENKELLFKNGFEIDDFGANYVTVHGVPADIKPDSIEALVEEMASRLSLNTKDTQTEKTEWILHSIACRAAIKGGDKSTPQDLLLLAQAVLKEEIPPYCPHGRPIVLEISEKELEKQFGRLG